MKKKITAIIIFICIAAAVFIIVRQTTVLNEAKAAAEEESTQAAFEKSVLFVTYANTYLSIDKNGVVCANSGQKPNDIPELTGVEFENLEYAHQAEPKERSALQYAIKVAEDLEKYNIEADSIIYQNKRITIKIGNLEIELGKNEKTDDKINDLNDLIDQISGKSGTLYMQNENSDNYGYTFREK